MLDSCQVQDLSHTRSDQTIFSKFQVSLVKDCSASGLPHTTKYVYVRLAAKSSRSLPDCDKDQVLFLHYYHQDGASFFLLLARDVISLVGCCIVWIIHLLRLWASIRLLHISRVYLFLQVREEKEKRDFPRNLCLTNFWTNANSQNKDSANSLEPSPNSHISFSTLPSSSLRSAAPALLLHRFARRSLPDCDWRSGRDRLDLVINHT